MAKGKKPPAVVPQQVSFPRWFLRHIFSVVRRHGNFLCGCALIGYSVHQVATAFAAYAGRHSVADLKLGFLANVSFVFTASLTLAGASIGL
jgi:hypothetical protein